MNDIQHYLFSTTRYLFTEKSPHRFLEENGYGTWKPHIAEKILRVCHLQAPIVDKLTSSKHKFLWLTDRDSITEDIDSLGKIFQNVFNTYATHGFSIFSYAKPFQDSEMRIDDLLSIPDLVAGSVLEYFHECESADKGIKDNFEIQDKSNRILVWLSNKESKLKKLTCRIYPTDGGKWAFSFLGFEKKDEYGNC